MQETVVLYAAPGMGHIVSMVQLGKLIMQHGGHQFSITILLTTGWMDTPGVTSYIHSISQSYPSISFRRFPHVSPDTSGDHSPAAVTFKFIHRNAPNVLLALQEISATSKIRVLVIDMFCTSALSIGKELRIPTFYFYTSGASALAAFLQFPKLLSHEKINQNFRGLRTTEFHFHGVPPIKASQMPEPLLDRDDPSFDDFMYFCSNLPKADGIIANTFDDLEPIPIKAIADGVCVADAATPPTYYIGPLIAANSSTARHDCLDWLDKQPSRSVVFLCFGSRGAMSPEQVKEIANGLERSGQRFLWVVKNPPDDEKRKQTEVNKLDVDLDSLLPEGFLNRVEGRGMVVKAWAPQVAVLSHESVGGFVTHCGWNSVLETVVGGVPMIAWPLYAEQHLNRNVLVQDMKMAIPAEQREGDGFVSGTEVEKRVRELMESETGQKLKEKSWKMKQKALEAWWDSGSSIKALERLMEVWKKG
ncbi:hypothetical protein SLE2022_327880 [Rubroshorea leprosula]